MNSVRTRAPCVYASGSVVAGALAVALGSLLGFAVVSRRGFEGDWVGWTVAGMSLCLFCTAAAAVEW